jgi:hypothetical protein
LKFDYSKNIKLDNNIFRKVERCLKWIFQNIFVNLLRKIISIMALLEWNYYKAYPSGSEQYLIFTK